MKQILGIMTLTRLVWCCECLVRKQKHESKNMQCFVSAVLIMLNFFFSENFRSVGLFSLKLKTKVFLSKRKQIQVVFFLVLKKQRYFDNIGIAQYTGISSHFCGIARKHDETQFALTVVGTTLNWLKMHSLLFRYILLSVLIYDKYTSSAISP